MVKELITQAGKHGNGGMRILIPSKLHHDSQNPIKPGDRIKIEVDGERIVITPAPITEARPP